MYQYIGGNPLNRNDDDKVIYTIPNHLPPSEKWSSELQIKQSEILSFIEQLYFVTMEQNGFSYFYPDYEENINICRFEWHYGYKNDPYFYRVGLLLEVKNSKILQKRYYIILHEELKDIKKYKGTHKVSNDGSKKILNLSHLQIPIKSRLLRV